MAPCDEKTDAGAFPIHTHVRERHGPLLARLGSATGQRRLRGTATAAGLAARAQRFWGHVQPRGAPLREAAPRPRAGLAGTRPFGPTFGELRSGLVHLGDEAVARGARHRRVRPTRTLPRRRHCAAPPTRTRRASAPSRARFVRRIRRTRRVADPTRRVARCARANRPAPDGGGHCARRSTLWGQVQSARSRAPLPRQLASRVSTCARSYHSFGRERAQRAATALLGSRPRGSQLAAHVRVLGRAGPDHSSQPCGLGLRDARGSECDALSVRALPSSRVAPHVCGSVRTVSRHAATHPGAASRSASLFTPKWASGPRLGEGAGVATRHLASTHRYGSPGELAGSRARSFGCGF